MIPHDVMPLVFIEGTDYEMGYQYGQQVAEFIPFVVSDAWVRALKRGDPRHPVASSREAVLRDIAVYRDLLRRHMPEQIEQLRGMVDALKERGQSVAEADLLLIQAGINRRLAAEEAGSSSGVGGDRSCCAWSAWGSTTKGGQLICADSCDGDLMPQVCIVAFPKDGYPYITAATAGELSNHPAYSHSGLFFGDSGGNGRRLIDWGYGLRWNSVIQHCVRFASGAEEARRMITSWPHALPENYHLVDKTRAAVVIELTAAAQAERRPGDYGEGDFLYSTNNFVAREMQVACDPNGRTKHIARGGWPGNAGVPRNLEILQLLSDYAGQVDLEFAKMMWRFPGSPPPVPPDGGWSNMICRLSNNRVALILPDQGELGTFYLCTGPVGRVICQFRRSTFPVQGTHSFVQIPVCPSPDETAEAMYNLSCDAVAFSHHSLASLSAKHPGFFGLRETQARAHAYVYEGKDAYYRGLLSSAPARIGLLASAATAFGRAQAYANETREMISPPPSSPDQMGLRPWKPRYSVPAEYGPGFSDSCVGG